MFAWFELPESRAHLTEKVSQESLKIVGLLPYFAITFIGVLTFVSVKQITGLRLQDVFGFDAEKALMHTGSILTLTAIAMLFSQIVLIRLLKLSATWLLMIAALCSVFALLLAANSEQYFLFVTAMIILGLANGLLLPTNLGLLSLHVSKNVQGKAAGLNAIFQGLAMVMGPIVGAQLFTHSDTLTYWLLLPFYIGIIFYALYKIKLRPLKVDTTSNTVVNS